MSEERKISNDKSRYLNTPKRTEIEHRSGLAGLKAIPPRLKKVFTLHEGRKKEAEHVIVPADKVAEETIVHPMNPRNQKALNDNSVRDIYGQIEERGVDTEGVAVKRDGKYLLIEGSRRRYCCIKAVRDLPLWVLPDELNPKDVKALIEAAQTSRRFSYREMGFQYLQTMREQNFTKNEELATYLGISHVSVSKRVQATQINASLITIFPDYEGIPNSFYSRLARIQKYAEKQDISLSDVIDHVKEELKRQDTTEDITEMQKRVMEVITKAIEHLDNSGTSKGWNTRDLITFTNKDKYARISRNASGRKVKFEFNRLSKEFIKEIEEFIIWKLGDDSHKNS